MDSDVPLSFKGWLQPQGADSNTTLAKLWFFMYTFDCKRAIEYSVYQLKYTAFIVYSCVINLKHEENCISFDSKPSPINIWLYSRPLDQNNVLD